MLMVVQAVGMDMPRPLAVMTLSLAAAAAAGLVVFMAVAPALPEAATGVSKNVAAMRVVLKWRGMRRLRMGDSD